MLLGHGSSIKQSQKHPSNKICSISMVSSAVYSSGLTVFETQEIDELFIHSSEREGGQPRCAVLVMFTLTKQLLACKMSGEYLISYFYLLIPLLLRSERI